MHGYFCGKAVLAGVLTIGGLCAWGQAQSKILSRPSGDDTSSLEVAFNYEAIHANTVPSKNFWMNGGSMQVTGHFTRHWGVTADISGVHSAQMPGTTVGLDLVSAVFGPRYTITLPRQHMRVYGEALAGEAFGLHSLFPGMPSSTDSANSSALLIGGGVDYRFTKRISWRAVNAHWLRTSLANGANMVQNNLRVGSGVALRF